eukprot:5600841-Prymnesium_polylepis.1
MDNVALAPVRIEACLSAGRSAAWKSIAGRYHTCSRDEYEQHVTRASYSEYCDYTGGDCCETMGRGCGSRC